MGVAYTHRHTATQGETQMARTLDATELAYRKAERIAKGRPAYRINYTQPRPDWKHYPVRPTVAPDPILNLLAARKCARMRPSDPAVQQRYGEMLQRVVSPVHLPDLRA